MDGTPSKRSRWVGGQREDPNRGCSSARGDGPSAPGELRRPFRLAAAASASRPAQHEQERRYAPPRGSAGRAHKPQRAPRLSWAGPQTAARPEAQLGGPRTAAPGSQLGGPTNCSARVSAGRTHELQRPGLSWADPRTAAPRSQLGGPTNCSAQVSAGRTHKPQRAPRLSWAGPQTAARPEAQLGGRRAFPAHPTWVIRSLEVVMSVMTNHAMRCCA
jgi:hypothetical protein